MAKSNLFIALYPLLVLTMGIATLMSGFTFLIPVGVFVGVTLLRIIKSALFRRRDSMTTVMSGFILPPNRYPIINPITTGPEGAEVMFMMHGWPDSHNIW